MESWESLGLAALSVAFGRAQAAGLVMGYALVLAALLARWRAKEWPWRIARALGLGASLLIGLGMGVVAAFLLVMEHSRP